MAESTGGTEPYLIILAEMAMAQSNRSVPGPARAFLPTQSTFLRRIDMLKGKTPFRRTVSRSTRAIAVAAVLFAGFVAVGIRGDRVGIAQDALPVALASKETEKFGIIDFIPDTALAVLVVHPSQILSKDSFKPIRNLIEQDKVKNSKDSDAFGLKLTDIDTAVLLFLASEARISSGEPTAVLVHANKAIDREAAIEKNRGKNVLGEYKGHTYLKHIWGSHFDVRLFLDKHTMLYAQSEQGMHTIIDTMQEGGTRRWAKQWDSVKNDSVAGLIDMRVARAMVGNKPAQVAATNSPVLGLISPIWENTDVVTFGMTVSQNISLNATLSQDHRGESVKETVNAVLTLVRNMLGQMKQNMHGANVQERLRLMSLMNSAEQAMKSAKVIQKGEDVTLTAMLPNDSGAQMIALLVPAVMQARESARRAKSMNNLKQILLALHFYHEKHNHFPPPVVMGPDGKTPHSWRVEILPFLDQQPLYDSYRMDEPWDSEHNLKIAQKQVSVFHDPSDNKPANASYFAVVGKNTVFGNKTGIDFRKITDGLSNTIAIVEAKRDIPWTKPEDIQFDGKQVPKFGGFFSGGFNAALSDGSVRFFPKDLDQKTLKNLLIINDGNQVEF